MPAIVGTLFLLVLLAALGWLYYRVLGRKCPPKFPAEHIELIIRRSYNKMAFHPGDTKILVAQADGDGVMNGLAVVSSDENVVNVSPTGDPNRFQLTFVNVGHADLTATATNSDGSPITGVLGVDDVAPAATTISLSVE